MNGIRDMLALYEGDPLPRADSFLEKLKAGDVRLTVALPVVGSAEMLEIRQRLINVLESCNGQQLQVRCRALQAINDRLQVDRASDALNAGITQPYLDFLEQYEK